MGCVVSQARATRVRIAQTPLAKVELSRSQTLEKERTKKGLQKNLSLDERLDETSKLGNRSYKQALVLRWDPVSNERRKPAGEKEFIIRRSASVAAIKGIENEDLFCKKSNDSSIEKSTNLALSRRRTSETSLYTADNSTCKTLHEHQDSNDKNIKSPLIFKRTSTTSFSMRPSIFYLEQQNTPKNVRSKTNIPISSPEKDVKTADSIDSPQKLNLITPNSRFGSKKSTDASGSTHDQLSLTLLQSNSNSLQFSDVVREQNCESEKHAANYEQEDRKSSEKVKSIMPRIPWKKATTWLNGLPVYSTEEQQSDTRCLEPLTIKIASETQNRLQADVNTPIRALPLAKNDQNPNFEGPKSGQVKQLGLSRGDSSSELRGTIRSSSVFMGNSPKLSVAAKFKCNLLDIVKNEEDDISPIISTQQKHISKMTKPLVPQSFLSYDRPELSKIDSNLSPQQKFSDDIAESISQKQNCSNLKEPEQTDKESPQFKEISPPKTKKGLQKLTKNLLDLAREEDADYGKDSSMFSLSKLEKIPSNESNGAKSLGLSPISGGYENNFRNNFVYFDASQTALGQCTRSNNQPYPNVTGNNQTVQTQVQLNMTANGLNETQNPSIYNIEGNVTAMNISNFVFYYENEEVEYDEARGINRTSGMPDYKILSALWNSPSNGKRGVSPINNSLQRKWSLDEKRWPEFGNTLTSSALLVRRKDSEASNGNCMPVNSKKETFSSLCFNRTGLSETNSQEIPKLDRGEDHSPQPLEEVGSPKTPDQLRKLRKYKSLRKSIFLQESNAVSSEDNMKLEEAKKLSADQTSALKILPTIDLTQQSNNDASSILRPAQRIEERSEGQKNDEVRNGFRHQASLNDSKSPLSIPTSPISQSAFQRRNSINMVSPNLRKVLLKRTQTTVIETPKLNKTKNDEGQTRINQYLMIKDIGKGGFGKVKLAQDTLTNDYYAIKIVNKTKMKRNLFNVTKDALSALDREIAIMKKLDHPNIVKLWEVIDDPKEEKLFLVMDLVKKGAVMSKGYWKYETKEALDKSALNASFDTSFVTDGKKVLIEEKALKYFRELILGLDYLHNYAGVIHRDIKPENLLIDEFDSLKISDFGVSLIMEDNSDELKNNAGTKLFLPPESFGGKSYKGKPADIWAAGATLFYFLTGKPPFPATVQSDLMNKVMNEEPVYPESMSKKVQDVIKGCLQKDPEQRSTIQDIMKSDWLTEDGQYMLKNMYEDDDEFKLSEEEIVIALTKLKYRAIVKLKAYFKQHLSRTRDKLERRKSLLSQPAENQTKANTVSQNQATQSRVNLLKALQ